jgi:Domain of unknown function (DUF5615)
MTVRLYIDEDSMDNDLVIALRMRGVDVATPEEEGTRRYSDAQQLAYAMGLGRVVYSFNIRDYMLIHTRLLEAGASHAGLILCEQQKYSVGEQLRRLQLIMTAMSADEMQGQALFLSNWG